MQTVTIAESALSVGNLITSHEQTTPQTIVNRVAEQFFNSTELDAMAVVECAEPVGLVTRPKLLFTLFRRFGFELYGKNPVVTIADTSPLIVSSSERLDVIIDKALERPSQDIYDEIVVTDDCGRYRGLLSVKQLVVQQSNALAASILQREMASERAKELKKINEVKSRFLANVTHELRSPVNIIIGLAELLRIAADKSNVDQVKDRLSLLLTSATNLRTIVTNILDLSKIEAGKMEIMAERFDAAALLREAAEATRVIIGQKPVDVEVHAASDGLFITSDPGKLRQILINLSSNAAKFTERGKIIFSLKTAGDALELSVSDTGIGIKEDDTGRIFTVFGQLEDARTKRHEGTGLGLAITKNLVDMLGGAISFTSTFGRGTTFTVSLPTKKKEA